MSFNQSLKNRPKSPSEFGEEDEDYYRNLGKEPKTPPLIPSSPTPDDFLPASPLGSPRTPTSSSPYTPGASSIPELELPPAVQRSNNSNKKIVSTSKPPIPALSTIVKAPGVPRVSVIDIQRRTLKTLPDRASASIQRVVNHRIKKQQRSKRPRMTKDPRSSPFHCRLCQVTCTGRVQWHDHLRSRKHGRRANPQEFKCVECDLILPSGSDLRRHKNGVHHRLRVRRFN